VEESYSGSLEYVTTHLKHFGKVCSLQAAAAIPVTAQQRVFAYG
jgi:hypothetical protein